MYLVVAFLSVFTGGCSVQKTSEVNDTREMKETIEGTSDTSEVNEKDEVNEIGEASMINEANKSGEAGQETYEQISAEEAKNLMDTEKDYIIIDARTQEEYDEIEDFVFELNLDGYMQDLEENEEQYVPNFE